MKYYFVAITLVFVGVFAYFAVNQNKTIKRLEDNISQLREDNKYLVFTQKEFNATLDKRTDSLLRISKIKPKQVTEVTNVYHQYYTNDTNIVINPVIKPSRKFNISDTLGCIKITGYVLSNDTPFVAITSKRYENRDTYIAFLTSKAKWFEIYRKEWWKSGSLRKYVDLNVYSDCGESRVEKIKIEKGD